MVLTVSIDKNVTSDQTIEFLKEFYMLGASQIREFQNGKDLFIYLEIKDSILCQNLRNINKENIYINILNEKGMGLFTTVENDNVNCFIPMHNILSISIDSINWEF